MALVGAETKTLDTENEMWFKNSFLINGFLQLCDFMD